MIDDDKMVAGFFIGISCLLLVALLVGNAINATYNKRMFNRMSDQKITYAEAFWGTIEITPTVK